jgi:hypothetical protein
MTMKGRGGMVLLAVTMAAFLGFAVWVAWQSWFSVPDTEMGFHGTLALVLGAGGAFVVGAGLMALVFLSSRGGHDQ